MKVWPEHFKGSANELKAALWYLNNSWNVFFPVVPQGPVDFIADVDGCLERVQVKTATWNRSGKYEYLQCRTRLTNKYKNASPSDLYDTLFIVHDNEAWNIPAQLVVSSNLSLKSGTWDAYHIPFV